jgi:hypothetical protein
MVGQRKRQNKGKTGMRALYLVLAFVVVFCISAPRTAWAQICVMCECYTPLTEPRDMIEPNFSDLEAFLQQFFPVYERFMRQQTAQTTPIQGQKMTIIGKFFDAKEQMDYQLSLEEFRARVARKYQPSVELCTIGTLTKSLAGSEHLLETTLAAFSQRSQDRQLGNANASSAEGEELDRLNRLEQFRRRYCDVRDNDDGLALLCTNSAPAATINKDIDFMRTVDRADTLDVDFTDVNLTNDEQDILALADNLYGHKIFTRVPENLFNPDKLENQDEYFDLRSLVAKRSVAENSFFNYVAMRTVGSPPPVAGAGASAGISSTDTAAYMRFVLQNLGLPAPSIQRIMGSTPQPSYYAQMEILTKKVFQDAQFYVNLYDTPVNVERKGVTLQAIAMMQDFDTLKSYLRTEAMLATLLETELIKQQKAVENRLNQVGNTGRN